MDSGKTIFELKSAFIRTQVRILSESLDLPKDWRNYAPESDESDLTDRVIEDVVHKGWNANHNSDSTLDSRIICAEKRTDSVIVNAAAKQHNRVVYSSQAIHHVAQQIASLYWSSTTQDARSRDIFARGIEKTTDLSRQM